MGSVPYGIIRLRIGWCGVVKSARGAERIFIGFKSKIKLINEITGIFPEAFYSSDKVKRELIEIDSYLSLRTKHINIKVNSAVLTPFQLRVFKALSRVGYGKTTTYEALAAMTGVHGAARAVGNALARNPFPLAIPCHRVIRKCGSNGRFSSPGGSRLKKLLITLEKRGKKA